jgi:DNA-binding transcriptional MocR family regulator
MQYGDIALRKGGPTPLYRQVAAAIRDACARGELAPGERLPAIRTLADMLQVSQVTVAQAYELLRSEGVVAGHVGRGTFVQARAAPPPLAVPGPMSASPPVSAPPLTTDAAGPSLSAPAISSQVRAPRWQAVYLTQEQIYRRAPTAQEPIYFSRGVPDSALFPLRRWRHSMRLAADRLTPDDPTAAQYGPALGDPQLREVIATGLRRHGIRAEPQEILLTSGTLQSLDLIARTFLHPGATVFVEEVSYMAALDIFEQRPIAWQPLPVDQQGLQVEALPAVAGVAAAASGRPRLLYTCPSGQSPTGYSMSQARRRLLAELADRYDLLVIADEAFNELYLDDPPPPPAVQGFANAGRVISLVSFSKTIFPGVRMGCIVAAQPLVELLAQTKALFDREASLPLTRAVAQHIAAPAYARELARARQEYRARRDLLLDLLQRELAPLGCRWTVPAAGFSLLMSLPPECEERAAVEEAAWQGVMVLPGSCFAPVPTPRWRNAVRLTYGDLSPDQQCEGVQRLARALRVVLEQHTGRIQDHSEPV